MFRCSGLGGFLPAGRCECKDSTTAGADFVITSMERICTLIFRRPVFVAVVDSEHGRDNIKLKNSFTFGALSQVRRIMVSRLIRIGCLVLLGTSLASPRLRTLQLAPVRELDGTNALVIHRAHQRVRTVIPCCATLPKARGVRSDLAADRAGQAARSGRVRSTLGFDAQRADAKARRDSFYHPLRC